MKKQVMLALGATLFSVVFLASSVEAQESNLTGKGTIEYTGDLPKDPVDPENPTQPVDPGPGPSTDGPLRFDFASTFNFGSNKITNTDRKFYVNAQSFHTGQAPRGNYIQITDSRAERTGWTLQVKQEQQFNNDVIQNASEKELRGATLSFDKAWANSAFTQVEAPHLSKDIIELSNPGTAVNVATAESGQGRGTWLITFGASSENNNNQENTLFPKTNEKGEALLDPVYENQPVYGNKAIFLSVPNETKIHPVQYQTELTWILAELP